METELTGIMHFGKYRGKTIAEILDLDPQYLLWADKNVKEFKLSRKALYEVFDGILKDQMNKLYKYLEVREESERQIDSVVTTVRGRDKINHILSQGPFSVDRNDMDFFLNSLDEEELGDAMGFDSHGFGDH